VDGVAGVAGVVGALEDDGSATGTPTLSLTTGALVNGSFVVVAFFAGVLWICE